MVDNGGLTFAGTARLFLLSVDDTVMALILHEVYRITADAVDSALQQPSTNRMYHLFPFFFRIPYKGIFTKMQLNKSGIRNPSTTRQCCNGPWPSLSDYGYL
ncbi:uncharacterized protein TrAtP1_012324 [Trichoderma atroviride]|uniref:uncharacterized protein n=1 Tax=Hypocrea atroviridis TaxID=63577 RepID=UPI0033227353|nr:hypothetical protein TrAtP1_012324 [Trichoderma atroviride]